MSVAVNKSEMFLDFCRIPVIDMHDFSQDEINLAAQNSDVFRVDDVVVPKIDPSIFQESGGSRKQTYSRLHLSQRREEPESLTQRRAGLLSVSRRRNVFSESEQQEARRILDLIQELLNNGDHTCKSSSALIVHPLNRTCNVEDLYTDRKNTSQVGTNCLQLVVKDSTWQNEDDANLAVSTPDTDGTMAIHDIGIDNSGIDRAKKKIRTKEGARRKPFMNAVEAADEQMFLKVARSNAENTDLTHNDNKAPENMEENATCNDEKAEDGGVHVDNVSNSNALPFVSKEPFVPQLKRKFTPLATEAELQEFFNNIGGEWASKMKKRKIVDAEDFGEGFPKGWKLLLGVRKKYGRFIIECRKYISPDGLQFASCREVSAYFLSNSCHSSTGEVAALETPCHADSDNGHQNVIVDTPKENTIGADQSMQQKGGDAILTSSSNMGKDTEQQSMEFNSSGVPGTGEQKTRQEDRSLETVDIVGKTKKRNNLDNQNTPMNCKKCSVIFSNRSTFMAHLTIHHVKKTKILDDKATENGANMNNGKSIHHVKKKKKLADKAIEYSAIMKNGKYECQICHKAFSERNRYTGHIGVHARKNTKKPQVPLEQTEVPLEQTGTETKGDLDDKESSDVKPLVHVKMEDNKEILETNATVAQEGVSNSLLEFLGAASGEDSSAAPNIRGFVGSLDSESGKDQAKFTAGNEKSDGISDFGKIQMFMPSPKFSFGTGQDANCAMDAPMELGLDGDELHEVQVPPEQFGWDPFLSERENSSSQFSVCIWCNTEFSHDGIDQDQQADSVGFICPVCKTKISGQVEVDNELEKV